MKVLVHKALLTCLAVIGLAEGSVAQASFLGRSSGLMAQAISSFRSCVAARFIGVRPRPVSTLQGLLEREAHDYTSAPAIVLKQDATLAKKVLVEATALQLALSCALGVKNYVALSEITQQDFVEVVDAQCRRNYGISYAQLMKMGQEQRREKRRIETINSSMNVWMRDLAGYI